LTGLERGVAGWVLMGAALAGPASAQTRAPTASEARLLLFGDSEPVLQASAEGQASPLATAGLSLVLPGAGQHTLGQNRKWIYAALEVAGWIVFFERRSAGGELRDQYRDFAWDNGRIQSGPRMDGDFDYYETVSKWEASGDFDTDPALPGIQPEMDLTTFNGSIWALASQIFIPGGGPISETDPAYQSALAYYVDRAYGTAFLWDWSVTPGGREELGELIEESDDRFRQATTALGALIANHLISAVDAYLSARGRSAPASLSIVPDDRFGRAAWSAVVSVPLGR
jgi:hypothetical protein